MRKCRLQFGLTVVEVLISVAILAILVAGLFTVGSYVNKQAQEKLTESTIETLVTALEQYYDFYNEFPDPNDSDYDSPPEALFGRLYSTPGAKKVLMQISETLIADKDSDDKPEVYDPWGTPLRYIYNDGDNFPVITSAGPDKEFGTDDDINSK